MFICGSQFMMSRHGSTGSWLHWCTWVIAAGWFLLGPAMAHAQAQNGITEPAAGDVLSGIVIVRGTAFDPDFLRYEIAFYRAGSWIVFAEGDRPVVDGTLAIWDTTVGAPNNPVFPDGSYELRLRVVRQDYNYSEYFVSALTISNEGTVTPTATVTASATPLSPDQPGVTATARLDEPIIRATVLPSLTPFPTPSPEATPRSVLSGAADEPATTGESEERGLLTRLRDVDYGRFGRAFWLGARLAFYAFVLLGGYLLLRWLLRLLWRLLTTREWR
jgi:hypothetical protein